MLPCKLVRIFNFLESFAPTAPQILCLRQMVVVVVGRGERRYGVIFRHKLRLPLAVAPVKVW